MPYSFTPRFKRLFTKKPAMERAAIMTCVNRLMTDPTHPGLRVHKMQGVVGIWEAYVSAGNRVTFARDGDHLTFRVNCNHDVLRNP